VTIITVGRSRSSEGLKKHFPAVVHTEYLDTYEIPNQIGRAAFMRNFNAWRRDSHSAKLTPWEWQLSVTMHANKNLWLESCTSTEDALGWYLSNLNAKARDDGSFTHNLVMAPIGLLHPFHICVADIVRRFSSEYSFLSFGFYSEAPYNSARWVRALENSHPCTGKLLPVTYSIGADGIVTKERVFRDVYPTEVKIFRFTRREVLENLYRLYLPPSWVS